MVVVEPPVATPSETTPSARASSYVRSKRVLLIVSSSWPRHAYVPWLQNLPSCGRHTFYGRLQLRSLLLLWQISLSSSEQRSSSQNAHLHQAWWICPYRSLLFS